MSLYGALFSGVSGLAAQSSAMGAISDNVTNINTVGFKGTKTHFSTLVTKQVSSTKYSPGGVQSKPTAGIDIQGLLTSTTSSTDFGVSGNGFFVVNEAATPGSGDRWGYTRAGAFKLDNDGFLRNTSGYYIQSWPLTPHDGTESAPVVNIGELAYMKAYKDDDARQTYINDNIIDSRNLKPVNLNTIGGNATPTTQIRFGANLPADDPVFDKANPELGGRHSIAVLIYDSLGNAHNVNYEYTKETQNAWGVDAQMPPGSASLTLFSDREATVDGGDEVYSARGQLEFTEIPSNHSTVSVTHDKGTAATTTYVYEFTTDGTTTHAAAANEVVVPVDISVGVVSTSDAIEVLEAEVQKTMPSGQRFYQDGNTLAIFQSLGGAPIDIDASNCLACAQSNANPDPVTGIPSGGFSVPEIDWEIKNAGRIDFDSTDPNDYSNVSMAIGKQIYEFTNTAAGSAAVQPGNIEVNVDGAIAGGVVDPAQVVTLLTASINTNAEEPSRFVGSGRSLEVYQSETGQDIMINTTTNERVRFSDTNVATYVGTNITLGGNTYTFTNGVGGGFNVDLAGVADGVASTPQAVMNALKGVINQQDTNPSRFTVRTADLISADTLIDGGSTVLGAAGVTNPTTNGLNGGGNTIVGEIKADGSTSPTTLAGGPVVIGDGFTFNGSADAEDGFRAPAVRFNSDGTPKYFNLDRMSIEWANGAEDMVGTQDEGDLIEMFTGSANSPDGLTHLSGDFVPNYIAQDGAKFGNFAGVTVGEDGIVTALFDNGETEPIAMIPLATFVNPNGMESLTGNAWIETDYSGQPTLRQAGDGGAGVINSASLESSTVDLGEEFTDMITTQRAYSAAAKIITTSDEMLDELIRIKR